MHALICIMYVQHVCVYAARVCICSTSACMHKYAFINMHVCLYVRIYVCVHACMHVPETNKATASFLLLLKEWGVIDEVMWIYVLTQPYMHIYAYADNATHIRRCTNMHEYAHA